MRWRESNKYFVLKLSLKTIYMFTFEFLTPYLFLFFSILFYSNCVNNEVPNTKLKLSNSKIPQFDMVVLRSFQEEA
jgi:hypothetical protein